MEEGWKEFICTAGSVYNSSTVLVPLQGVAPGEKLTPKLAARASIIAFGHRDKVTVRSNDDHWYRLYVNDCRKLKRTD